MSRGLGELQRKILKAMQKEDNPPEKMIFDTPELVRLVFGYIRKGRYWGAPYDRAYENYAERVVKAVRRLESRGLALSLDEITGSAPKRVMLTDQGKKV